jgi:hypothetical protein
VAEEWTIETLKAFLEQRLDATEKALELQAVEYERRLADLNNAHERAITVAQGTVSREAFETYMHSQDEKAQLLALDMGLVKEELAATRGRSAAYTVAMGLVFAALAVALRFVGG